MQIEDMINDDRVTIAKDGVYLLILVLVLTHWMACIFFFVGDSNFFDEEDTWILANGIQDASSSGKYI